jgi:hypothetical protein
MTIEIPKTGKQRNTLLKTTKPKIKNTIDYPRTARHT